MGLETMLRMYLLQIWFSLSDEGIEEALYDSSAMQRFMGTDFEESEVPDATTLLHFRHLLEREHLAEAMFEELNVVLNESGCIMRGGSIVDATIIEAPSSTKNAQKKRDEEMHSTRKNGQYHFGMKLHIGVDAGTGLVHHVSATPANTSDISMAAGLLREDDTVVYGDAAYTGLANRPEILKDANRMHTRYRINVKRKVEGKGYGEIGLGWLNYIEGCKASVRCKIEHVFHILKNQFGFRKTVYRGIAKNLTRSTMLLASVNLLMLARAGRTLAC